MGVETWYEKRQIALLKSLRSLFGSPHVINLIKNMIGDCLDYTIILDEDSSDSSEEESESEHADSSDEEPESEEPETPSNMSQNDSIGGGIESAAKEPVGSPKKTSELGSSNISKIDYKTAPTDRIQILPVPDFDTGIFNINWDEIHA